MERTPQYPGVYNDGRGSHLPCRKGSVCALCCFKEFDTETVVVVATAEIHVLICAQLDGESCEFRVTGQLRTDEMIRYSVRSPPPGGDRCPHNQKTQTGGRSDSPPRFRHGGEPFESWYNRRYYCQHERPLEIALDVVPLPLQPIAHRRFQRLIGRLGFSFQRLPESAFGMVTVHSVNPLRANWERLSPLYFECF